MADIFIVNEGATNGVAAVTALAAPASAIIQRVVAAGAWGVYNNDSVQHDVIFQKKKAGTVTILQKITAVQPGELAVLPKIVGLDAADETLENVLGEAMSTVHPRFDICALEAS